MNGAHRSPATTGTVFLVGAGPGDPGLITVRGLELLRRADAVVYDALANPALLEETPLAAELIYAGKRAANHAMSQERINELLYAKAREHGVVVRLKAGDPFVFGRGGEEAEYLRAKGVPVEVVPGVSSAIAAAEAAGVPLTHRGVSSCFAVVTGHMAADATSSPPWHALAQIDTLVVMMALSRAGEVSRRLVEAGRAESTPAMIVASATLPSQQTFVTTLAELESVSEVIASGAPATIIVGEVVNMADPEATLRDLSVRVPWLWVESASAMA